MTTKLAVMVNLSVLKKEG